MPHSPILDIFRHACFKIGQPKSRFAYIRKSLYFNALVRSSIRPFDTNKIYLKFWSYSGKPGNKLEFEYEMENLENLEKNLEFYTLWYKYRAIVMTSEVPETIIPGLHPWTSSIIRGSASCQRQ